MIEKRVSVIMGIYNCESTLADAIECILNQSYKNWELIMCDDGSTDKTLQVAIKYKEKYPDKIFVLQNRSNKGLNYTLNRCLYQAKGELIARMDGDDLCSPDRFEKEVNFLDNNPDLAIVSTGMEYFDENGIWGEFIPQNIPNVKNFAKGTPFCHAPCMVRKEAYIAVGGYSENKRLLRVEDYHLWIKMYRAGYKGRNLSETLYQMRDDRNAYNRRKFKYRINEAYVKYLAVRLLKLPVYNYIYVMVPVIKGVVPEPIYKIIHKKRLKQK